jgi:cation diffusion facilitator family transporter
MANCCEDKSCALDALQKRQASTLKTVLWINAVMFFVVLAMGIYAGSAALLSDALDNFGDALTYAISLYAVGKSVQTKSRVALFKGILILAAGIGVMAQVLYKALHPETPVYEAMGATSLVALAANGVCLWLLWSHRDEDVNMSSVWHCSRNDIAANLSVLAAAVVVWLAGSPWPDLALGFALGLLFVWSAAKVLREAIRTLGAPAVARQV